MTRTGKNRSLASLALLRLSESDLRSFHEMVRDLTPSSFMEMVRDIEDEIDNSMSLALERTKERAFWSSNLDEIYQELDQIRKNALRVSVQHFADLLSKSLSENSISNSVEIPRFDPHRGHSGLGR